MEIFGHFTHNRDFKICFFLL